MENKLDVKPSTIYTGDNLDALRRMESGIVDLIYADPPFKYHRIYAGPIAAAELNAAFHDAWTLNDNAQNCRRHITGIYPAMRAFLRSVGKTPNEGIEAYLIYMAVRLHEMKRLLKETGSIYFHCDPTVSHQLKVVMDIIFGKDNCRTEIVWSYPANPSATRRDFPRLHDTILHYARSKKSIFNAEDVKNSPRIHTIISTTELTKDRKGLLPSAVWQDIDPAHKMGNEFIGYPTQKPVALLKRIIRASSNKGDLVLDPFCGGATTCVAAEAEGRKWIGIDITPASYVLVRQRFRAELGIMSNNIVQHSVFAPPRSKHRNSEQGKGKQRKYIKDKLFDLQGGSCNGCQNVFSVQEFTLDHIVPQAEDGPDSEDNMQLLCASCNKTKDDGPMEDLLFKLRRDKRIKGMI